ncbi:hypothetical protein K9L05_03575 [Candidatus Babeliales bacterium]|nr:hypothetical protein [Candidatus Babeliales bacterium]MCF7899697.1 hypothetical protein [Candidatus Babeliales bacterium]
MSIKNIISSISKMFLVLLISAICLNMSPGPQCQQSIEPTFVPLESGKMKFEGIIYDGKNEISVKDISFTGHISICGIRKETDNSINKLELSKIKQLDIVKPIYISKKYADKEFILANAITNDDIVVEGLLIPRHVVICAVEAGTQMEKAWFLYQISKLVLKKDFEKNIEKKEAKEEQKTSKKQTLFKKITDSLTP